MHQSLQSAISLLEGGTRQQNMKAFVSFGEEMNMHGKHWMFMALQIDLLAH